MTMLLHNIKFPVYILRKMPILTGHVIYEDTIEERVIDNKLLKGNTLGKRRLHIPKERRARLRNSIFSLPEFIKKARNKIIIDSQGKVYKYKPSMFVPLICRKIIGFKNCEGEGRYLLVDGIPQPILVSQTYPDYPYIGLLVIDGGYYVYNFYKEAKKDGRIKI